MVLSLTSHDVAYSVQSSGGFLYLTHNDLKAVEKRKMRKTIQPPALPDIENVSSTTHSKHIRRYDKARRIQRKKEQFRAKHRFTPTVVDDRKLQHLNPINLSEQVLSEDQTKLLRKGPSFCPAPRDINWQEVHDDLEAFEARLRTAVFFMEKDAEEPASNVHSQVLIVVISVFRGPLRGFLLFSLNFLCNRFLFIVVKPYLSCRFFNRLFCN